MLSIPSNNGEWAHKLIFLFLSKGFQDGVPLWEKKFCTLVGSIPWGKVVDAKKFMYCHNNILSWDDSAGEEAFQNAKKRFWAKINGLQCDISLPDPDVYIGDIDWNPTIDSELIKELDQNCFAPDEEERNTKVWRKNKKTKNSVSVPSEGHNMNHENNDNPLECNNMQDSGASKNKAQGWNQWEDNKNDSRNLSNGDNPWEPGLTQCNGGTMDNTWGHCGDKSWGWNKVGNHVNQARNWDKGANSWEHGCQGAVSVKDRGWGDLGNKAWGWNQQELKNLDNSNRPWESRFNPNRGWRDCGGNARGLKQWDNNNNELKHGEFRRTGEGWGTRIEGCWKREGSHPYVDTKSSMFQGNGNQRGDCWRRGQTKKRVSFAP